MKTLDAETNLPESLEQTAEAVMETVAAVTRSIRHQMRRNRPAEMSVQQFRALRILQNHPGASLSAVARHLGLTAASTSKLVDALVKQGLATRADSPEDRRMIVLDLTKAGQRSLDLARTAALGRLSELLAGLDEPDLSAVRRAMDIIGKALV